MTKSKSFNEIVSNFRNEVASFLKENNLNRYSIHVRLREDRPTGKILEPDGLLCKHIAYFDDAQFLLVNNDDLTPELEDFIRQEILER